MSFAAHSRLHPAVSGRLNELLEAIKNEFESVNQDTSMFKMQRDDFEHKISAQIQEMTSIQQNVFELERVHQKMKQQYEEEILRLRRELEQRGIPLPASVLTSGGGSSSGPLGDQQQHMMPPLSQAQAMQPYGGGGSQQYGGGNYGNGQPQQPQQQQSSSSSSQQYYDDHKRQQQQQQMYQQHHPQQQQQPHGMQQPQMGRQTTQQMPQSMQQQKLPVQPPVVPLQQPVPVAKALIFNDVEMDSLPAQFKKEGSDWVVMFNPKFPRSIDINLQHSFDHSSVVCCIRYSQDGKYLATGCNRITQIYDVKTGQLFASLSDDTGKDGDLYIRSVCFSPDGSLLATGAEDKQIRIWNLATKSIKSYLAGHEQDIYSLEFSHDGRVIASGSGDKTSRIWEVSSGRCLHTLVEPDDGPKDAGITSVAISPDSKFVATGSLDRIVRIWSLSSGQFIAKLAGHKDSVYSVAFAPDSLSLVSGSLDKTLKLWDLSQIASGGQSVCRSTFVGHKDFVLSVAFSQDGRFVISGSKDRSVQVWDVKTEQSLVILQGHKNSVISVALSPAGGLFATGSGDCRARVWNIGFSGVGGGLASVEPKQ